MKLANLEPLLSRFTIRTKAQTEIPFTLNWAQRELVDTIAKQRREGKPARIICLKARQLGVCLAPETRILTSDLQWVPIADVRPGDRLVSVDENRPSGRGRGRKMRQATVEATRDVYEPAFQLLLDNGETLVATGPHRFLSHDRSGTNTCWRAVDKTRPGDQIRYVTQPWGPPTVEDGWFGGLLDGEGSLALPSRAGVNLGVSQVEGAVLERAAAYLKSRGYDFRVEVDNRKPGDSSKWGGRPVHKLVVSRMNQMFRLVGQTRPTRFIDRPWWEGKDLPGKKSGEAWATVLSITPIGEQRMIDLQTSTGTFIAEGFVSHNSTVSEALLFGETILEGNTNAAIVAHDADSSEYLFQMTRLYYDTFPFKQLYPLKYATRRHFQFTDNGSNIWVLTAKHVSAGRGRTIHKLHASEIAFWAEPTEAMLSLHQAVPNSPKSLIILESTANGMGNWFEDQWTRAVSGETDYVPLFFPWWKEPSYIPCTGYGCMDGSCKMCREDAARVTKLDDEERELARLGVNKAHLAWRRWAIANLCFSSVDLFHQEYPSCLVAGTRVGTAAGIVPIEEIEPGQTATRGIVEHCHVQEPSQIHKLRSEDGYQIRGTWHHPVFLASGLLVPLAHLQPGMDVQLCPPIFATDPHTATWTEHGITSSLEITPNWGRLLGYFMGDGSFHSATLSIVATAKDEDVIDDISGLFKTTVDLSPNVRAVGPRKGGVEVRAASKFVYRTFEHLGLCVSGKRRVHVPEMIWRSPKPVVKEFLRGLFEADGFNDYKCNRIVLFSKHSDFMRDVQMLLLGFGITCRVRDVAKKRGEYTYMGCEMTLRSAETLRFHDEIGFVGQRKSKRYGTGRQAKPITLTTKVKDVTEDGFEATYDLTVAGHAFDANGILTHNTDTEAFIVSGVNAFPEPHLKACYEPLTPMIGKLVRDDSELGKVRFIEDRRGPLRVYRRPSSDTTWGQYFIGADAGYGVVAGDYSAAQVINRHNKEQVAVWHGQMNPIAYADELAKLGAWYNTAPLAPETEGPGYGVIGRLSAIYPRIWQHTLPDRYPGEAQSRSLGWSTNWKRKQWAIMKLAEQFERQKIIIHDRPTFQECRGYTFYGAAHYGEFSGNFGAPMVETAHDDLVMALAICSLCDSLEPGPEPYETRQPPRPDGLIFGEKVELGEAW